MGQLKQIARELNLKVKREERSEINANWVPKKLVTMNQVILDVKSHKDAGNDIKAIYLQTHGSAGTVYTGEGEDGIMDTDPAYRGNSRDIGVNAGDIEYYLNLTVEEQGDYFAKGSSKAMAIKNIVDLGNLIDDGGTLIFGGCNIALGSDKWGGDRLLTQLNKLTGDIINIVASQVYVTEVRCAEPNADGTINYNLTELLDRGRAHPTEIKKAGFKIVSPSTSDAKATVTDTGKDLQLNSTGEVYEFINPQ